MVKWREDVVKWREETGEERRRPWLVVVILRLGDTDLGVPMRNLTFRYILFGMIVAALSMATLNHLETPNRVDGEFWGGVNGIGQ